MQDEVFENYQMKVLEVKIDALTHLVETLAAPKKEVADLPEHITLEQAVALKGGCALNTVKARWWLQPCAGTNSHRIGGRKCWNKSEVLQWLEITDADLPDYARKFGIKKIPERK